MTLHVSFLLLGIRVALHAGQFRTVAEKLTDKVSLGVDRMALLNHQHGHQTVRKEE